MADSCPFCGQAFLQADDYDIHVPECKARKALRNSLVVTFAGLGDDPVICWEKADAVVKAAK